MMYYIWYSPTTHPLQGLGMVMVVGILMIVVGALPRVSGSTPPRSGCVIAS